MNWKDRARAAGIHLLISLSLAALTALLVFELWYPYPYRTLSGGRDLFGLVVGIDVLLGPFLTFSVFNRKKPRGELIRDLSVIGLLQLAALCYGLWTVCAARPVHMVFEFDRFRVVHAIEIDPKLLQSAPPALRHLPLTGPTLLAVRDFKNQKEKFDATMAALSGVSLSSRPDFWQAYDTAARARALAAAKPVPALLQRHPEQAPALAALSQQAGSPVADLRYLPAQDRSTVWTAILQPKTGDIIGYLPLDSF